MQEDEAFETNPEHGTVDGLMALTITLIIVAMLLITALELWALWTLGERDDRRRQTVPEVTPAGPTRAVVNDGDVDDTHIPHQSSPPAWRPRSSPPASPERSPSVPGEAPPGGASARSGVPTRAA